MKAVVELTRITPDTLRAWERRHNAITPARAQNGRRVYSSCDIARLRLLKCACSFGHTISNVARLSNQELQELIHDADSMSNLQRPVAFTDVLLKAIQNYDMKAIDQILGLAVTGMSPVDFAARVLSPTLVDVGNLWHRKKINVAQEHLFSNSIKRLIFSLIHVHHRESEGPKLVFGGLSPERHELGLLMCCLIATGKNCRCYYLGADLPSQDLIDAVTQIQPRTLVLSMVQENLQISELIERYNNLFPSSQLWIGGPGSLSVDINELPENCKLLSSFDHFITEIGFLTVASANRHGE